MLHRNECQLIVKYNLFQPVDDEKSETLPEEISDQFKLERVYKPYNAVNTFYFSNDSGVENIIPHLQSIPETPENDSIAIIVGNGNFLSLAPYISASTILFCDINPEVLNWMSYFIETYLNHETESAFMAALKSEHSPYYPYPYVSNLDFDINQEKIQLGAYHYYNSNNRERCVNAITGKRILFVPIDLTDSDVLQKLNTIFIKYNKKISFMNLTNVGDWVKEYPEKFKNYQNNLLQLPYTDQPQIIYSSNKGLGIGKTPIFRAICYSVDEYCSHHEVKLPSRLMKVN